MRHVSKYNRLKLVYSLVSEPREMNSVDMKSSRWVLEPEYSLVTPNNIYISYFFYCDLGIFVII